MTVKKTQQQSEADPSFDISSELELRKARYSHVEREADTWGRLIGVRRLKLSEQTRLTAMTPDLGGMDEIQNPDFPGSTQLIQQRAQYYVVAMVCEIQGAYIPFPRNRGELDSILDRLDMEGLKAASEAVTRLIALDNADGDPMDKAKNSSATPGSE